MFCSSNMNPPVQFCCVALWLLHLLMLFLPFVQPRQHSWHPDAAIRLQPPWEECVPSAHPGGWQRAAAPQLHRHADHLCLQLRHRWASWSGGRTITSIIVTVTFQGGDASRPWKPVAAAVLISKQLWRHVQGQEAADFSGSLLGLLLKSNPASDYWLLL